MVYKHIIINADDANIDGETMLEYASESVTDVYTTGGVSADGVAVALANDISIFAEATVEEIENTMKSKYGVNKTATRHIIAPLI